MTGLLLLNMGSPNNENQIGEFLYNLFSDPGIIRLPFGKLYQKRLAKLISRKRAPSAAVKYRLIGGKSPLIADIQYISDAISKELNVPAKYAFQYAPPYIKDVLKEFYQSGIEKIIVLPMYPQYSISTTEAALNDFNSAFESHIPALVIKSHYDNPGYIKSIADKINDAVTQLNSHDNAHILFAAHSIPVKYDRKGDPYKNQTEQTVELVMEHIDKQISYSLAYQSKVGPVKWLEPDLQSELDRIVSISKDSIIVVPVSFFSECLETLYDLDIELKEYAKKIGIKYFVRIKAPGRSEHYIKGLCDIIRDKLNI